ncbi:hypothetical protein RRG08_062736 [Elysia crispata]|uniref:Plethodontid modulating factor n=1 Tax=Elysia crispata TaxID=231223 RepID=A0AAE0Z0E2_9GAST|nr:hypothetical protein RRG08_062736 [Elysia crispata]
MKTSLILLLAIGAFIASAAGSACIEEEAGDADGNPCSADDITAKAYTNGQEFCCAGGSISSYSSTVNGVTSVSCTCN